VHSFRLTAAMIAIGIVMTMPAAAQAFTASFSWDKIRGCGRVSPAFRLAGVPQATVTLRFSMVDLDMPSYHHGGSSVRYRGGDTVARGAIRYIGPCPPPGDQHNYRWTVEALDAAGKVIATTTASGEFPP